MDDLFRFKKFGVYNAAREFRKSLKSFSKNNFPNSENDCLRKQLWRALDSIVLNIAEGSERYSDLDFSRFLNTSITSLGEVVSCLDLAFDDNYITTKDKDFYLDWASKIYKQLRAFSSKVRKDARYKGK